jgi:hypothetical protein
MPAPKAGALPVWRRPNRFESKRIHGFCHSLATVLEGVVPSFVLREESDSTVERAAAGMSHSLWGRQYPVQQHVFQVPSAIEEAQHEDAAAGDTVEQTVGGNLNLAVFADLEAPELRYDSASQRQGAQSGGPTLDFV